jgi:hypothetical protein
MSGQEEGEKSSVTIFEAKKALLVELIELIQVRKHDIVKVSVCNKGKL